MFFFFFFFFTKQYDIVYWAKHITLIAIFATFLLGVTGNSLVMFVIGRHGKVRVKSVANYYIWNLALADLLFVLALPLTGWATYINGSVPKHIVLINLLYSI